MKPRAKAEIAARRRAVEAMLEGCRLCPRECGVNRRAGAKGFCGVGAESHVFREMVHDYEEQAIRPAHQVYFAGCNLRCGYCSVGAWNRRVEEGAFVGMEALAERVRVEHERGARTLNLLGGEPAVNLSGVLELLERVPGEVKVVFNSNMYFRGVVLEALEGLVDIYLADLKCGNAGCAAEVLGAGNDYVEVVTGNILAAAEQAEVMVRHLLMPGHEACCYEAAAAWMGEHLPGRRLIVRRDYAEAGEAREREVMEIRIGVGGEVRLIGPDGALLEAVTGMKELKAMTPESMEISKHG